MVCESAGPLNLRRAARGRESLTLTAFSVPGTLPRAWLSRSYAAPVTALGGGGRGGGEGRTEA